MLPRLGLKMAKKPTWAGTIAGVVDGVFADEAAILSKGWHGSVRSVQAQISP